MSHFGKYATAGQQVTDQRAISRALTAMGIKHQHTEAGQKPIRMHDYYGNYSLAADVVVKRDDLQGLSADLGFQRQAEGHYEIIMDTFGQGDRFWAEWRKQFAQQYTLYNNVIALEDNGFTIDPESIRQDDLGNLYISLEQPEQAVSLY